MGTPHAIEPHAPATETSHMDRRTIALVFVSTLVAAGILALVMFSRVRPIGFDSVESPIQIVSETVGHGRLVDNGDVARISYSLALSDGTPIKSDDDNRFIVGGGSVIEAVDTVTHGMRVGGTRDALVPPRFHWGRQGYGPIPPNSRLHMRIELLDVEREDPGELRQRMTVRQRALLDE